MRFAEHRARMLATVDKTFAEQVLISFLAGGVEDPDRGPIEILAKLRVMEGKGSNDRGDRRSVNIRVAAGRSKLSIDRARYTGPMPTVGDVIRALERPGQPWFEVARVDDRDPSRLVLELNEG